MQVVKATDTDLTKLYNRIPFIQSLAELRETFSKGHKGGSSAKMFSGFIPMNISPG